MPLLNVPMESGGVITVEVDQLDLPGDLALASPDPGRAIARLGTSFEHGLDMLNPVLDAIANRLKAARPDEFSVEFGVKIGGDAGIFIARGTAEVNFLVTMKWNSGQAGQPPQPPEGQP